MMGHHVGLDGVKGREGVILEEGTREGGAQEDWPQGRTQTKG